MLLMKTRVAFISVLEIIPAFPNQRNSVAFIFRKASIASACSQSLAAIAFACSSISSALPSATTAYVARTESF
jgi:hypothetical protein